MAISSLPYPRERAFFAELDRRTMPEGLPSNSPVLPQVLGLLATLQNRLGDRLASSATAPRKCINERALRELSRLQLELFAKHFPRPDGLCGIDLDRLEMALLLFANGSLHDEAYSEHGQPNGAGAFLFAEFAFAACESGIDAALWSALLPALVLLQAIYIRVYEPEPRGGAHAWNDWSWKAHREGSPHPYSEEELEELLRHPPAAPFDAQVRANLLRAFSAGIPQA